MMRWAKAGGENWDVAISLRQEADGSWVAGPIDGAFARGESAEDCCHELEGLLRYRARFLGLTGNITLTIGDAR